MISSDVGNVLFALCDTLSLSNLARTCRDFYSGTADDMEARLDTCTVRQALRTGSTRALKHLSRKGRLFVPQMYISPDVVVFLHTECRVRFAPPLLSMAASHGQLDMVKALHRHGCPFESGACVRAASEGHLEVLRYLHRNGCALKGSTGLLAAENGHVHILRYMHAQGIPWDAMVCAHAALNGHLDIVEFVHASGGYIGSMACSMAAQNGHLHVLQYLYRANCRWDAWTCIMAAFGGHLDVLRYAHLRGCPLDRRARNSTHASVILFLDSHGCPH